MTICVQDERPSYASVAVRRKAAIERVRQGLGAEMAKHYLGAVGAAGYKRTTAEAIEGREEVTVVVTPERVLSQDFSQETPWFGKAWLVLKRVLPPSFRDGHSRRGRASRISTKRQVDRKDCSLAGRTVCLD